MNEIEITYGEALAKYTDDADQKTLKHMVVVFSINYIDSEGVYHEESWELSPDKVHDYGPTRKGRHLMASHYQYPLKTRNPVSYIVDFSFRRSSSDPGDDSGRVSPAGSFQFVESLKKEYGNMTPLCPILLGYIDASGSHVETYIWVAAWREGDAINVKQMPENLSGIYPVRFESAWLDTKLNCAGELLDAIKTRCDEIKRALYEDKTATVEAKNVAGGKLALEYLTTNQNTLIGAPCHVCKTSTAALRRYFKERYPENLVAFNKQYRDILETSYGTQKYAPLDELLFSAAAETSFIVLHCDSFSEGIATNPELLDGFMRVLWSDKDDDVIVKVYCGLSEYQQHQVMVLANTWKMRTEESAFVFDRGFSLFLWERAGVILNKDLSKALSKYCDFRSEDSIVDLWKNRHLIADVKFMSWLHARTDGWKSIREETALRICQKLGAFRRANPDKDMRDVNHEEFGAFLDSQKACLDKIVKMKVSGQAVNSMEKSFEPHMVAFLREQLRPSK